MNVSLTGRLASHAAAAQSNAADGRNYSRHYRQRLRAEVLLDAVTALLVAASSEDPVVVVLDDLHWADAASVQVLRHLVWGAKPMRVLALGTFRDTDLSSDHPLTPLLADLRRNPRSKRLRLDGLADPDVVDLIAAAAGHELDEAAVKLAHTVRAETGGNPFFMTELLRHLGESGAFVADASGRYAISGALPELRSGRVRHNRAARPSIDRSTDRTASQRLP